MAVEGDVGGEGLAGVLAEDVLKPWRVISEVGPRCHLPNWAVV